MANYDNKGQPGWAPPAQAPPYSPPGQPGWAPPPPGQGYSQPQQAYGQPGQAYQPGTAYGSQGGAVVIQQPPQQTILVMGGCPTCRVGQMEDEFTCCDNDRQLGWVPPLPAKPPPSSPLNQQRGLAPPPPGQAYSKPVQAYQPDPSYVTPGGSVLIQQPPKQTISVLGGCPTCRVGQLVNEFTCCGILCCILFFPLGLICLFTMVDKRCTFCSASSFLESNTNNRN